jgi:WD40 repeat protein
MSRWSVPLVIALLSAGGVFAWPPRRDALGDPLPAGAVARLGTTRLRHAHYVTCVAFSPDGKTLATGSRLGDLRLWNVVTGGEIRTFPGHRLGVTALAFSPDGKSLISGGGEPSLQIHDVMTGKPRPVADVPKDAVWSLAVSPDGKWLAVGGAERGGLASCT